MNRSFLIILMFLGTSLFALNNQARIDILKIKLVEQQKKGNYYGIISSIKEWKKIDRNIPLSLVFWEGKSYYKIKNYVKSYESLEYYINVAGNSGRFYQEALKLYLEVEPKYKNAKFIERKKLANKNRVVIDNNTGLMWQDDYDSVSRYMGYYSAKSYCEKLTLRGYSDWSLPTANQAMTLFDFSKKPAISSSFKNTKTSRNWNVKHFLLERNSKYSYNFSTYTGAISHGSSSSKQYVRCVRKFK